MATKIIIANWKMNKTNAAAVAFFEEYSLLVKGSAHKVIICAPFTALPTVVKASKRAAISVGAQNVHAAANGTYTGEISSEMLVDAGAKFVLVGHSERRAQFGETDVFINGKVKAALGAGLTPILCVGETAAERDKGKTLSVLRRQVLKGLEDIDFSNVGNEAAVIVAYEPVWAISGGDPTKPKPTPTGAEIGQVHAFIKELLKKNFAAELPVLYGGSANDKNCAEIFGIAGVDGVLVGGASLEPKKFAAMVNQEA